MLKIKNLTKSFGSFTAVNNLSIELKKGELYGFLGPNGAGKTTTIKLLTGLLNKTEGDIFINGLNATKNSIEVKKFFGYVPDHPYLYDKLTGREYLYFIGGLYRISKKEILKTVSDLSEMFQLKEWLDRRTEEYSQGMKQRIVFASALLHNPQLLIIDEPMIGLDPQSALMVKKILIDKTKDGLTVFMSTHSLNVVEEICSRVGIINNGKLIENMLMKDLKLLMKDMNHTIEDLFIKLTT